MKFAPQLSELQLREATQFMAAIALFAVLFFPCSVLAQSGTLPWETPLCTIVTSIRGPVAIALSVVALVVFGVLFAFSESGSVASRIIGMVAGISLAVTAAALVASLFPLQTRFCNIG